MKTFFEDTQKKYFWKPKKSSLISFSVNDFQVTFLMQGIKQKMPIVYKFCWLKTDVWPFVEEILFGCFGKKLAWTLRNIMITYAFWHCRLVKFLHASISSKSLFLLEGFLNEKRQSNTLIDEVYWILKEMSWNTNIVFWINFKKRFSVTTPQWVKPKANILQGMAFHK